jgi:hypothetical protein
MVAMLTNTIKQADQREIALANARLIVAAPELLEALKNLKNDDGSIPAHAWNLVKSAIAKAEGAPE